MEEDRESLLFLGAGPLLAILMGMALVPLRGLTTASNLSFAFMALTIVVAEFGGRWAAIATALTSALSLDFFLTQPYLRLSIEDKHDVIAFVGLAVCGLIAAALGSQRGRRVAALQAVETHGKFLSSALREWNAGAPAGPQLTKVLRTCREVFPLSAAVIRDERGRFVAGSQPEDERRALPDHGLQLDSLLPSVASDTAPRGLGLPEQGGRIPLTAGTRQLGWLDVWGSGAPANVETRRALSDLARLLALLLAGVDSRASPPDSLAG